MFVVIVITVVAFRGSDRFKVSGGICVRVRFLFFFKGLVLVGEK